MTAGALGLALVCALAAAPVAAESLSASKAKGPFRVSGTVLLYDTTTDDGEIEAGDTDRLLTVLRANPGVTTIELHSTGGDYFEAFDLARAIADFGLSTHVAGSCESSCAIAFLGGTKRSLARGGRIGFHQTTWSAESAQSYYEDWAEDERWRTPFDMVSWTYEDTQTEIYDRLVFMIGRGVDPRFAIETLRQPAGGIWYPGRDELLAAGYLTE